MYSLPFAGRWVRVAQADLKHCLWRHRQPAAKPAAVSAARAEPRLQARVSLGHPESVLPPFHHWKVVQINESILKRVPEALKEEFFMTKHNRSMVMALQQYIVRCQDLAVIMPCS